MKIAVVFPKFSAPYGAERLALNMCSEFIKLGNNVTLFTTKLDNSCRNMLNPKVKLIETGTIEIGDWDLTKLIGQFFVAKIYRQLTDEFDVINLHNYPTPLVAALVKKIKRLQIPVIYQCNEPPRFLYDLYEETYKRSGISKRLGLSLFSSLLRKLDKWSVSYVDEIITISNFKKEEVKKIYRRDSIFIMPGIETKSFNLEVDGSNIRTKYTPKDEFFILASNKLHPRKKIDVLVKSIPLVIKKHKNIKVVITGDGIERRKLEKLIQKFKIENYVKLVGFISEKEFPQYYAACDVFVFTAIREPQIGSPAEALASGKPVIAPNDGSPAETIIEGKTGFLYKPLDYKDLARKINWCIENREKLRKMSKDCREWVEENMTWEKMTKETLKIFKKVAKND